MGRNESALPRLEDINNQEVRHAVVCWRNQREEVIIAFDAMSAEVVLADALERRSSIGVVGLDTEWGRSREVAVLQLAWSGCCLLCLFPCSEMSHCASLVKLLEDPCIMKAGIGIGQDAAMLRAQAGIQVCGCCDLFLLAAREGRVSAAQPCSLATLSQVLLATELPKDDMIRRSDWSQRPLSGEHLAYAARDALAGRDCAEELARGLDPKKKIVDWCSELMDRVPKLRPSANKSQSTDVALKAQHCKAYASVQKFGDRRIIDSSGRLLLHMRERTAEGLLRRGLASVVEDEQGEAVLLHFTPPDRYDYAGLDAAERNACVGCGCSGVARFYVIPHIFFVELPDSCKSYNCHDVVMLCPLCRFKAEPAQFRHVQELLRQHGARRAGDRYANDNVLTSEEHAAKRAAGILLRPPRGGKRGCLPEGKKLEAKEIVAKSLGIQVSELTHDRLQYAYSLGEGPLPSERVCQAASKDADSLRAFLRCFREVFVAALQPQFLPEGWSVDAGLEDGRFVPSVASSLEWPGDWRCSRCGVHCFGRNSSCRKCGSSRTHDSDSRCAFDIQVDARTQEEPGDLLERHGA